jgi:hypothetical protein
MLMGKVTSKVQMLEPNRLDGIQFFFGWFLRDRLKNGQDIYVDILESPLDGR